MMVGNGYASQRRGTSSSASISLARLAGSLAPWRRARSWSSSASAKALSSTSAAVPAAPVGGPAAAVAAAAATQAAGKSAARAAAAMGAAAVLGVSVPLMHTLETSLTDAPPSFAPARPALSCSFPLVPPQHVLLPSLPALPPCPPSLPASLLPASSSAFIHVAKNDVMYLWGTSGCVRRLARSRRANAAKARTVDAAGERRERGSLRTLRHLSHATQHCRRCHRAHLAIDDAPRTSWGDRRWSWSELRRRAADPVTQLQIRLPPPHRRRLHLLEWPAPRKGRARCKERTENGRPHEVHEAHDRHGTLACAAARARRRSARSWTSAH